ncbi:uncharacterized protein LOC102388811 [Alligator sinensis]|uniref:Uncharacterized protein LOC102388811 n=1 Tax=Alligator sinensis TaxID=38654 RepID=A0A1U7RDE5_ALLSI|nr:uncharacterized protein LOC102388811 [Alligator sinensis]XP_025064976.1 uncharacterized protein LOC102388811 [Alligator sinensis]XP_025064979.1 uncharacterized protein LOC102388811 [Alligator sinensis]
MESADAGAKTKKTLGAVDYVESSGFAQGALPTQKDVIQNMLYLLQPKRAGQAQRSKEDAAQLLAELLQEHWLFCNLHTIATKTIKKVILKMYEEFTKLYQTRKQRQNHAFMQRADKFNMSSEQLFDIFCTDAVIRNKLEECTGIKMTATEWKFLEDQRSERKMYYEDVADTNELKAMERRRKVQCLDHFRKMAKDERAASESKETTYGSDVRSDEGTSVDELYPAEDEEDAPHFSLQGRRKRRYATRTLSSTTSASGTIPLECQHIRMSIRRVRPGFYETVDKI